MYLTKISDHTRKAISVGRENHYWFRPMGERGVLEQPIRRNEWLYIPVEKSEIDSQGLKRLEALEKGGIQIQQVIIAHEAPLLLPAPKIEPKPIEIPNFTPILKIILKTSLAVATGFVYLMGYVLMTAITIDPVLIAVLPDGTWVELCRWNE